MNMRFLYLGCMIFLLQGCLYIPTGGVKMVGNIWSTIQTQVQQVVPRRRSTSGKGGVIVRKGDTLYSIARAYQVPLKELIQVNRLRPPYLLKVGRRLSLPMAPYHIVQKGDTLFSIARRYRVGVSSLARQNKLRKPFTLHPGDRLALPGSLHKTRLAVQAAPAKKTAAKKSTWKRRSAPAKKTSKRVAKKIGLPPPRTSGRFLWPVEGKLISRFGPAGKGLHNDGINILAGKGTPVKAAENGVVAYAGNELAGFGTLLLVKHADGWMTAYAHLDKLKVKRGQTIKRGQTLATVGTSGNVRSPQIHFEVRRGSRAVDPLKHLEGRKLASAK